MDIGTLLTPAQVADRIQIQERTVTRWLRDGFLSGYKLGKEWRIASTDLEEFMERQANKAYQSNQAQGVSRKSG